MTQFTDKPKHKRTPSRRRKFLLMIVLPIVALMLGFVALSPQIDTWLATDPFTPQCQFEQDHVFESGDPLDFVSINSGEIHALTDLELESLTTALSPDGQYILTPLTYSFDEPDVSINVLSADGDVLYMLTSEFPIFPSLWSPDSRYFVYLARNEQYDGLVYLLFNIENGQTTDYGIRADDSYFVSWSPDGQYLLAFQDVEWTKSDGSTGESEAWAVAKLSTIDPNTAYESLVWTTKDEPDTYIGWSTDSKGFYGIAGDRIIKYDIESGQSSDVMRLPKVFDINPTIDLEFFYSAEREQLTIRNYVQWPLHINLRSQEITEISLPPLRQYEFRVSPDGRYIIFEAGINLKGENRYRLFDFETLQTISNFELHARYLPRWIRADEQDYLLINEGQPDQSEYKTYLWNPSTDQRCKIDFTDEITDYLP